MFLKKQFMYPNPNPNPNHTDARKMVSDFQPSQTDGSKSFYSKRKC